MSEFPKPCEAAESRMCHGDGFSVFAEAGARGGASPAGRQTLRDLALYFRRVIAMTDVDSNLVYVVALGHGGPPKGGLSWRDVVVTTAAMPMWSGRSTMALATTASAKI